MLQHRQNLQNKRDDQIPFFLPLSLSLSVRCLSQSGTDSSLSEGLVSPVGELLQLKGKEAHLVTAQHSCLGAGDCSQSS